MNKKQFKVPNPALQFLSQPETNVAAKVTENEPVKAVGVPPEGYRKNPAWTAKHTDVEPFIETKSKKLILLLQPSTVEGVREVAAQHGLSLNEAVNRILKGYLQSKRQATASKGL